MLNSALTPIFDIAPAVLAHGNDEATGAAAVAPASDGTMKRITTLFAAALFATYPITTGDGGIGAFKRGIGRGSETTRAGKQVNLSIARYNDAAVAAALTGSFAIYGVNLPDALGGKVKGNAYATQQTETSIVFKTGAQVAVNAAHAALDASSLSTAAINADAKGWNWLVVVNGQIITWSAAALANNISFSIAAGVITLRAGSGATVIPAGSDVAVYSLATADVTELLAAGTHPAEDVQIATKQVMWSYWTTNQIATTRSIATILGVA